MARAGLEAVAPFAVGARLTRRAPGPRLIAGAAVVALLGVALPSPAAAQERWLVVVSGLGGEPAFADSLHAWGGRLVDAGLAGGMAPERVVWLAEDPERDGRIDGPSRRDAVAAALTRLGRDGGPDDVVHIVLLGHGSADRRGARLNLPGPDVTAEELAVMLDALPMTRVAVVNTASASGAFLPALAAPGRAVLTATASGSQTNQTAFGRFFADAYADGGADTDKDGAVSLLEAFEFARLQVETLYHQSRRMQTEHALLDDDGDGEGAREPKASEGDGALAARLFLKGAGAAAAQAPAGASDELKALYAERRRLGEAIEALRAAKDTMTQADYDARLEELVVELALTNRAIRTLEGGGP